MAYNAAFEAHGLDFQWSVTRYRQLLALSDERQRIAAELRKRCVATEADVLTKLLADEIYNTKTGRSTGGFRWPPRIRKESRQCA